MPVKKLSLKGLADYMAASPTKQRTILRQFKYPSEDEARAKIVYYRETRDRITAYHRSVHPRAWLDEQAAALEALAAASMGRTKTRLRHNGRALRAYASHFAHRKFKVLEEVFVGLSFSDVLITVVPDLHVREGTKEKLIKLEFSVDAPDEREIQVISQGLLEAAEQAHMGLPASSVVYLDVQRGEEHRGARMGSRVRRDIESACLSISAIWDSL